MENKEEVKVILEEKFNFIISFNNLGMVKTDKGMVSNWSIDWITAVDSMMKFYKTNADNVFTPGISAVLNSKMDNVLSMLRAQSRLKKIIKREGGNIRENVQLLLLKKHTDEYAVEQELKKRGQ